jgi:hypothetical protein
MVDFAQITNHRFTETSKALQLQVLAAHSGDMKVQDTSFGDAFGSWCLIAVPSAPTTDGQGKITSCAEAIYSEYADEHVILGTRDVRVSKFAQDLKPGEVALLNSEGFRLFLGKKKGAFVIGGGYLSFDVDKKNVALVGIPSTPGGAAPYITFSPTILGLVSATGECSMTLSGANLTISGAAIVLDVGRVSLGKGATDPVVSYSTLMQMVAQIMTWATAVTAALGGLGPIVPPLQVIVTPGKRVFVPYGG